MEVPFREAEREGAAAASLYDGATLGSALVLAGRILGGDFGLAEKFLELTCIDATLREQRILADCHSISLSRFDGDSISKLG